MGNGRRLRIGILLLVLGFVAADAWLTRSRSIAWERTLWLYIYPIAGDDSPATRTYISGLRAADFADVQNFVAREAARHQVGLPRPLHIQLGRKLDAMPPDPPAQHSLWRVVIWSLHLRIWSKRMEWGQSGPPGDIRIYVAYHDPRLHPRIAHSLGLQQGLIGVVHAYASASQAAANNVVIAHELLHTLGARDKYDPSTGLPRYPDGYAEPERNPLYPQPGAEIMGGRTPISAELSEMPANLDVVRVNALTAREIGWTRP